MSNDATHPEGEAPEKGHGKKHRKHAGPHMEEEHHEGVAEWMISFADNALLQMGFFVILLAITLKQLVGMAPVSVVAGVEPTEGAQPRPNGQIDIVDAAIAIRNAFNNPVRLDSGDPRDIPLIRRLMERSSGEGQDKGPKGDGQKLQSLRPTDYHAIAAAVAFSTNSTELTDPDREVLLDAARRIRGVNLIVEVRGHASAVEAFDQTLSAMRLSFERSLIVANELARHGVDWRQMRLIGSGDNDRLEQTVYTADEQRFNQRVEVVLTDELMSSAKAPPPDETPTRPADKPPPPKAPAAESQESAEPEKEHAAPAEKPAASGH